MLTYALLLLLQDTADEPVKLVRAVRAAYPIQTDEEGRRWYGTENSRSYIYDEKAGEDGYYRTVEFEFEWSSPGTHAILGINPTAGGEAIGSSIWTSEDASRGIYQHKVILEADRVAGISKLDLRTWYGPRKPKEAPRRVEIDSSPVVVEHAGASITIQNPAFEVEPDGRVKFKIETIVPADRVHEFVFGFPSIQSDASSRHAVSRHEGETTKATTSISTKHRVEPVEVDLAVGFSGTCKLDVGGLSVDIRSVAWDEEGRRLELKAWYPGRADDVGVTVEGRRSIQSMSSTTGGGSTSTYSFDSVPKAAANVKVAVVRRKFEPAAEDRMVTVEVFHRDVEEMTFEGVPVP